MIVEDLFTEPGPSPQDIRALERLTRRRAAIEALEPEGEGTQCIQDRLLSTLDLMEESLCEEGHRAALVAEGWQQLDELEARLRAAVSAGPTGSAASPRRRRDRRAVQRASSSRSPSRETRQGRPRSRATTSTHNRAQEDRA